MGIRVTGLRIKDLYNPSESTNWLLAQRGEKLSIEVDVDIEEIIYTTNDEDVDRIALKPASILVNTTGINDLVYTESQSGFINFKVGDQITVSGSVSGNNGDYLIYDKINDEQFRVTTTGGGAVSFTSEFLPTGSFIANTTPFAGITYFFNFIENNASANYLSEITGDQLRFTINDADATVLTDSPMKFEGDVGGLYGTAMIKGRGISSSIQKYTITHETSVRNFSLSNEFQDLVSRVSIPQLNGGNTLKYITNLNAGRTLADPNAIQNAQFDEQEGNFGDYAENYNTNQTKYSLDSYSIERVSDSEALTALELTEVCDATIIIKNTDDDPFLNGSTKFQVAFEYCPSDEDFYQNNSKTLVENFFFDTAFQTTGAGAIAGDNNTTEQQIITEVEGTVSDAETLEIRIRFDLSTEAQSIISGRDLKRYKIYVTTQNHTLSRNISDKSTLLIDVNEFYVELFQSNLITNVNKFIQHPFSDVADGITNPQTFPVDDIVSRNDFSIDFADKKSDGIKINTITNQILIKKTGEVDIILDNSSIDVSSSQLEQGFVQFIDVDQVRIFKRPDDIRRIISIKRNESADAGDVFNWFSSYPFQNRWEYWVSLGNLNSLPAGIFDTTLPNNGINQDWLRLSSVSGWAIIHRLKFSLEQNGELFEQSFDHPFQVNSFNSNDNWINESIKSYNIDSGLELIDGSQKFIEGYVETKIIASYENDTGDLPTVDDLEFEFWIEVFEQGGINDARTSSSVYDIGSLSWFKSIDGSEKILKEKTGSVYTATILVDNTKLPENSNFKVYSRLHDLRTGGDCPPNGIQADVTLECLLTDVNLEPLLSD